MADYWKSTPKEWCKYCRTFYNATKGGIAKHESSDRHQNQLKRHVRELQRSNERLLPRSVAKQPSVRPIARRREARPTLNKNVDVNPQDLSMPSDPLAAIAMPGEWAFVKRVSRSPAPETRSRTEDGVKYESEDEDNGITSKRRSYHQKASIIDEDDESPSFTITEKTHPPDEDIESQLAAEGVVFKKKKTINKAMRRM